MPDYGKDSDPEEYQRFLDSLHDAPPDSHGFYGSSDHATKPDPLANVPIEERPLDPDFAREEAKRLARLQDEVIALMPAEVFYYSNKGIIKSSSANDISRTYSSQNGLVGGIGLGSIEIYQKFKDPTDQAKLFNSSSNISIDIDIHMDIPTLKIMESLEKGSPQYNSIKTRFIFDHKGNFGKLSFLPADIDNRPDMRKLSKSDFEAFTEFHIEPGKLVISEMTVGDFELVGMALQRLKDALTLPEDQAPVTPADAV